MKVISITENNNRCTWWRITKPFEFLNLHGHDAKTCWVDSFDVPLLPVTDAVVVLHRMFLKYGDEQRWVNMLKAVDAKKIIYELDDDIISPDFVRHMTECRRLSQTAVNQLETERQAQLALLKVCDEVTVSTVELATVVRNYFDGPIHVLKNAIDVNWFYSKLRELDKKPYTTIGWAGGLRPDADYEDMAKAWTYIDQKYGDSVRFIIGGYQPDILWESVTYERIIRRAWCDMDDWPASMQMDIGCVPMKDNTYNRCKSPIKIIEFALAGALPITSSRYYMDGVPVVNSTEQWIEALEKYINNPEERLHQLHGILPNILTNYDIRLNFHQWVDAYES